MSLKILLADDSMTAQNMGKKILTEGGYEVVAVSNGAMAMKRINADVFDLLILDVFMPGYSGLEVCEKVRAMPKYAHAAVLLAAGKMEPFRAEESNKVKADGVIIKPFEATDLLSTVQKIASKMAAKSAKTPDYEKTIKLTAPIIPESDVSYQEWGAATESTGNTGAEGTSKINVPQDVADSAAMGGFDGMPPDAPAQAAAPDAVNAEFSVTPATSTPWGGDAVTAALESTTPGWGQVPSAPDFSSDFTDWNRPEAAAEDAPAASEPASAVETPAQTPADFPLAAPHEFTFERAPAPDFSLEQSLPGGIGDEPATPSAELSPTPFESSAQVVGENGLQQVLEAAAGVVQGPAPGLEFTSAAPVGEVPVTPPPEFQPTQVETGEVELSADPNLVTDRSTLANEFATHFVATGEDVPVGIVDAEPAPAAVPETASAAATDWLSETAAPQPFETEFASLDAPVLETSSATQAPAEQVTTEAHAEVGNETVRLEGLPEIGGTLTDAATESAAQTAIAVADEPAPGIEHAEPPQPEPAEAAPRWVAEEAPLDDAEKSASLLLEMENAFGVQQHTAAPVESAAATEATVANENEIAQGLAAEFSVHTPPMEAAAPAPAAGDLEFAAALAQAMSQTPAAQPEAAHAVAVAVEQAVAPAVSAAAAAAGLPFDIDMVSRAVERVTDRMKAEIIAEIMREMKK